MGERAPHTVPKYVINLFFVIGLLSAIAFRALIIFKYTRPEFLRPTWYCGVIGYTFFFLYRYYIAIKRKKAIDKYGLIPKLKGNQRLSDRDREITIYLLYSIKKSRENINYLFIFVLSIVAILLDIFLSIHASQ